MQPPDVIAGLVWAVVALLLIRRRGSTAAYAGAVAVTWFAWDALWTAAMWHRFALMMLLVCAPHWLPRSWVARGILIVELVAVVTIAPWASPLGAVLLSAAFVVAVAIEQPRRGLLRWAAVSLACVSFALPVLLGSGPGWSEAIGWAYAGSMTVIALLVAGDLGIGGGAPGRLDLLVELESESLPSSPRERAAAARLSAKHQALLREMDAGLAELQASRRRLAEARLTAARELREDLEARVIAPLIAVTSRAAAVGGQDPTQLAIARDHLRIARSDIEAISEGLAPRSLERGLASALRDLASSSSVRVHVDVDEASAGSRDEVAASTAYLVSAEALTNTAKHAHADRITLELAGTGQGLLLTITDDGRGGADPAAGSGLRGLRDRVEAIGGTLTIDSDSSGTTVSARIPTRLDARLERSASLSQAAVP